MRRLEGPRRPQADRSGRGWCPATYSESALARLLRLHNSHGDDEARALLREAFTLPGDLQIIEGTLHVRLDSASAPRRSKALAALCVELTDTATRYPGTDMTLAYSVKSHPETA